MQQLSPDKRRLTPEQAKLAGDNMGLVVFVVRKYFANCGIEVQELISEGNVAICRAARTYDPGRSKFSTYASHCVFTQCRRMIVDRMRRNAGKGLPVNNATDCMWGQVVDPRPSPDTASDAAQMVEKAMAALNDRERIVVTLRQDGVKLEEIGGMLGVCRERVRQIQDRAYAKCRAVLTEAA